MDNWTDGAPGTGVDMVVWGLALLAWILFAGSLAETVVIGVLGVVFCWYGVGIVRAGSLALR